jgi:hypothetical protein
MAKDWKFFLGEMKELREILDMYLELRMHFQELGFTEKELERPKTYTDKMHNLRINIAALNHALLKKVNNYGFDVDEKKYNDYILSFFQKINDLTPLKENGDNQGNDKWDEDY